MQLQTARREFWILFVVLTEWQTQRRRPNSYPRTLHTSANKTFLEMTTGDIECIKYIVDQVLAERNMAADDDAKPKML